MSGLYRAGIALIFCLPVCIFAQQGAAPTGDAAPPAQEPALANRPATPPDNAEGSMKLDVVVTDKSGKPITGLDRADFTLLDNKQPAKILSFKTYNATAPTDEPRPEIILLFDTANVEERYVVTVRLEMMKFLRQNGGHLSQPVAILLMTNLGVTVEAQPSMDGNALAAIVEQFHPRLRTIGDNQGDWGDMERFSFGTKWLGSIVQTETQIPGRKLLIWVGPGWPLLDGPGFYYSPQAQQANFDEVVAFSTRLREARMVLYSVAEGTSDIRSTAYQDFMKGVKQAKQAFPPNLGLKVIAAQSGGRILGPDNDLVGQINRAIADATAFYTISFDPPHADRPNEFHDLKVQIGKPGLTARTNTGYYNQP